LSTSTALNIDVRLDLSFFFVPKVFFFPPGTSLVRSLEEAERKAEMLLENGERVKASFEQLKREHDEQSELCKQLEEFSKVKGC
jgi:hypothetical protein